MPTPPPMSEESNKMGVEPSRDGPMGSGVAHTPGTWVVAHPAHGVRVESEDEHGVANDGWCIAEFYGSDAQANARLCAAAPDLLEAAKTVLLGLNARIDAAKDKTPVFAGIAALHAAIAKAGGR
jgi:hypothetical protein